MSALGSSVINKSVKKFTPKKAPIRRVQDAISNHTSARLLTEEPGEQQAIQSVSAQSTSTTAAPVVTSPLTLEPSRPPPSLALAEQQYGNRPLTIPTPSRDHSLSQDSSLRPHAFQSRTRTRQQIPDSSAKITPTPLAGSATAAVDSASTSHVARNTGSVHSDAPPAKRRRVGSEQKRATSLPTYEAAPTPIVLIRETSSTVGQTDIGDESLPVTTEPIQAGAARLSHPENPHQNSTKFAQIARENATDNVRKPRRPRKTADNSTRRTSPGGVQNQNNAVENTQERAGLNMEISTKKRRKSAKPRSNMAMKDAAAAIVENAVQGSSQSLRKKGRRYKRTMTPEEAENIRINVGETKMADLCKDSRTGQKSSADKIIRGNERAAALKKKQQLQEEVQSMISHPEDSTAQASEVRESRLDRLDREWKQREEASANIVPQQRIVNGEIVLDTTSLRINRHAMAAIERDAEQLEPLEEDEYTRKVNSGLGVKRDKSGGWNEDFVNRFYDGLRMFGTDFGMISKMFPGKTRHSIKLKFCKEEKEDYPRIRAALLGDVLPVELEEFQKLTGEKYDDPAVLERDIEEDKRILEEEQEREKEAIETARRERAEQAEAERLASQGEESSGREHRKRKKRGEEKGRKRKEKGEKARKGLPQPK